MTKPPVSKVAAKSTPAKSAARPAAKASTAKTDTSKTQAGKAEVEAAPAVPVADTTPAPAEPATTQAAVEGISPQAAEPETTQEPMSMNEISSSPSETVADDVATQTAPVASAETASDGYLITSNQADAVEAEVLPPETDQNTPTQNNPIARRWAAIFSEEFTMTTFPTFDFAAPFQSMFADFQEKSKAAYDKSTAAMGDYTEFAKGNVEALVEAGKIFSAGLQEMTSTLVADSRAGFETLTAEVKELAAAKSPTDFLKLQNDLAKKHFDEAVAAASKSSEALVKLSTEAAKPITTRVSLAVEKIKTAA